MRNFFNLTFFQCIALRPYNNLIHSRLKSHSTTTMTRFWFNSNCNILKLISFRPNSIYLSRELLVFNSSNSNHLIRNRFAFQSQLLNGALRWLSMLCFWFMAHGDKHLSSGIERHLYQCIIYTKQGESLVTVWDRSLPLVSTKSRHQMIEKLYFSIVMVKQLL